MKIYRYEIENGDGPYHSNLVDILEISRYNSERTPSPTGFSYIPGYRDHRFGFTSLNQALEWFTPKEREALFYHHCFLYEFEIDEQVVHPLEKQVVFIRTLPRKKVQI